MFVAHKTATGMGELKRMDQIRNILEVYLDTKSIKGTARRLNVSKNTVREYLRRVQRKKLSVSEVLDLPEKTFLDVVYNDCSGVPSSREVVFVRKTDYWIEELRRKGVTRRLLWEEYRIEEPEGFGYSQFCDRLKREIGRRNLTLQIIHNPGEVLQIDFAGKPLQWIDMNSAEVHRCEVLVAVMPFSQYTFAIALPSQKVLDFIDGINKALLFFGKLPKVILSDNLKSFVIKADKYEPDFNELCIQLAAHYQLDLQAARVRKPKDKASVENMVNTVYRRVYAPLRNQLFYSMAELNDAIKAQIELHNQQPYQKRQGCRVSEFKSSEYPLMRDLPKDLFEIKKSTQSKVRRDYHVFIGEEKNYYSVPYQYAGRQSTIIYTSSVVEIYIENQRVATHSRLLYKNAYRHQTDEAHMPKSHSDWKKARGFNEAYFVAQAKNVGPATSWVIGHVLLSRIHQPQSYNSCLGILRLGKKYTNERLENACLRCQKIGKASHKMIKNILIRNLDKQSDPPDIFSPPEHENIRGPKAYQ